jgi:hypothetical protein
LPDRVLPGRVDVLGGLAGVRPFDQLHVLQHDAK